MKKFISKILYFLLPIVVIAYPLDCAMSYYLRQSSIYPGEFEVWNDIYNSDANCDVAIYGSSRAWVHIDPKIVRDSLGVTVYNFGLDGHNFWLQYMRHLELLKYNKKPKTIILSVDIFSLQKRSDLYKADQFLPYMLWNPMMKAYTSSFIGYDKIDYSIPLIRYAGKLDALQLIVDHINKPQTSERFRQNGYRGIVRAWNNDMEKAKLSQKSYEIKMDSNSIALFEKFIKACKSDNIELILVYTPEFIEGQKFVSNREDLMKLYKNFAKKYALNYYDYSNDTICLNKEYFYNASHLNKKGSQIFSRNFAKRLKERKHNSSSEKK